MHFVGPASVELRALANLRDLGGMPSAHAMCVRRGHIYRSAMLDAGDAALVERLRGLGLASIVDLRADGERRRFPTPWKAIGCTDYWCREHVSGAGNLEQLLAEPSARRAAAIRDEMIALYRTMPVVQESSYRVLFRKLAEARTPMLFHCAAGKDRTGVAAALILSALDVPGEVILQDYLETNAFDLRGSVWARTACSPHSALANAPDDVLEPLFAADSVYLEAMFEELNKRFGSTEGYLRSLLRIDEAYLTNIRNNLLECA